MRNRDKKVLLFGVLILIIITIVISVIDCDSDEKRRLNDFDSSFYNFPEVIKPTDEVKPLTLVGNESNETGIRYPFLHAWISEKSRWLENKPICPFRNLRLQLLENLKEVCYE